MLVNLTVNGSVGPGFLVAYPCGSATPLASNVNFVANEDRAGSTMVGLGPDGSLCLLSNVDVHVIVDVNGYFVPERFGPKAILQPFAGQRIVDSRDGTGGWSTPMAANEVRSFDPTPDTAVVDNVYAANLNVIATEGAGAGHLRLFPCGGPIPLVSSLNFDRSGEATNLVTVPTGQDGRICVFASIATQVVIDEFGTVAAPGLAKQLTISGAVPFPTFHATGLDYAMICPAGGADLTIGAVGTAQVSVTIDGAPATAAVTKHLVTDGLMRVKFTRGPSRRSTRLRCLPPDFPPYNVDRPGSPQPGWYIGGMGWSVPPTSKFIVILDNHGAVVWYKRTDNQFVLDAKPWPGGNIAWTPQLGPAFGVDPNRGYRVTSLTGSLIAELKTTARDTDRPPRHGQPAGWRSSDDHLRSTGARVDATPLQPVAAPGITLLANDIAIDSHIQELASERDGACSTGTARIISTLPRRPSCPQRFVTPTTSHRWRRRPAAHQLDRPSARRRLHRVRPPSRRCVPHRSCHRGEVLWKLGGTQSRTSTVPPT